MVTVEGKNQKKDDLLNERFQDIENYLHRINSLSCQLRRSIELKTNFLNGSCPETASGTDKQDEPNGWLDKICGECSSIESILINANDRLNTL